MSAPQITTKHQTSLSRSEFRYQMVVHYPPIVNNLLLSFLIIVYIVYLYITTFTALPFKFINLQTRTTHKQRSYNHNLILQSTFYPTAKEYFYRRSDIGIILLKPIIYRHYYSFTNPYFMVSKIYLSKIYFSY